MFKVLGLDFLGVAEFDLCLRVTVLVILLALIRGHASGEAGAGFVYLEKSVCRFRVRAFGGGREF